MPQPLPHPIALYTAPIMAALRASALPASPDPEARLTDGAYFSWDTERGGLDVTLDSPAGAGLGMTLRVQGEPRWCTFNIDLGPAELAPDSLLGLVVALDGDPTGARKPFVRSGLDGTQEDTRLDQALQPAKGPQALLHRVMPDTGLARAGAFHTLVLPLPLRDAQLTLADLRVFVQPADRGLAPAGPTLATAAL